MFTGGTVRNSPANAGDMGSIPGPGRFQMLWNNKAHMLQSPGATTTELACLEPVPQQKKPPQQEVLAPQ